MKKQAFLRTSSWSKRENSKRDAESSPYTTWDAPGDFRVAVHTTETRGTRVSAESSVDLNDFRVCV